MEATLCLRAPHFPARRPHGLGPFRRRAAAARAEAAPSPAPAEGSGEEAAPRRRRPHRAAAAAGAGAVVLTCAAVGAAFLSGGGGAAARALQPPGPRGVAPAAEWRQEVGRATQRTMDVLAEMLLKRPAEVGGGWTTGAGALPERAYAEFYRELMPYGGRSDGKKTYFPDGRRAYSLDDLVYEELMTKEDYTPVDRGDKLPRSSNQLYKLWSATEDREKKYRIGLVLSLLLINQKEYQNAKEICQQIMSSRLNPPRDGRPYLHMAIINMMLAVEGMLSPDTTSADEIEKMVKSGIDAWREFKSKQDYHTD